jgi:hypothetical protein
MRLSPHCSNVSTLSLNSVARASNPSLPIKVSRVAARLGTSGMDDFNREANDARLSSHRPRAYKSSRACSAWT